MSEVNTSNQSCLQNSFATFHEQDRAEEEQKLSADICYDKHTQENQVYRNTCRNISYYECFLKIKISVNSFSLTLRKGYYHNYFL